MLPDSGFVPAVDLSYWNTHTNAVDPTALANAGIRACMVRAGKGKETLGIDLGVDRMWHENAQALGEAGFPYMPFWRIFNLEQSSPVAQANAYIKALMDVNYNMMRAPVWIDAEEWQYEPEAEVLAPEMVSHWIKDFMVTLFEYGFGYIGFYTRQNWWSHNVVPIGVMNGHPLWVAHWAGIPFRGDFQNYSHDPNTWDEYAFKALPLGPGIPSAWQSWDAWQFIGEGSGAGSEFGFDSDDLDCNLIKTEAFERWFG